MTPPQPAAVLLLLAAALILLGSVHCNPTNIAAGVALTRADKCAICEATVHELIDDLVDSKSQPQLDLDLRGRLDPSGKRKGKDKGKTHSHAGKSHKQQQQRWILGLKGQ